MGGGGGAGARVWILGLSILLGLNVEWFSVIWIVEICAYTSIPVKEILVYPPRAFIRTFFENVHTFILLKYCMFRILQF